MLNFNIEEKIIINQNMKTDSKERFLEKIEELLLNSDPDSDVLNLLNDLKEKISIMNDLEFKTLFNTLPLEDEFM